MPLKVSELPRAVDEQMLPVTEAALRELAQGNFEASANLADQAWSMMPEPKFGWDSSLSYVRALVKVFREAGRYDTAVEILNGYLASSYYYEYEYHPHFLLGTVYYAAGDPSAARIHFLNAHKIGGMRCFQGERPEYKDLVRRAPPARKR